MTALNIKDPEAHRLAEAISKETGASMTRVVTDALRERFDRLPSRRQRATVEELMAIAKRARAGLDPDKAHLDHSEFLYDEHGLPK